MCAAVSMGEALQGPSHSSVTRHWTRTLLGGILALGTLPRLYGLEKRSLWFDEAFSWRLIQFPFFEMLQRVQCDNYPPLYFVLLQGWAALFGDSAWALRSLSALLGVATILGTYLFTAEAFGSTLTAGNSSTRDRAQGLGLFAALLVALSGLQIRYSWETRMYALATALTVFSSWALVCALRRGAGTGWWWLYGNLALLLVYTHYYGLFTVAMQAAFLAFYLLVESQWRMAHLLRTQTFWRAGLTGGLVVIGWLPWLPVFLHQKAQVKVDGWAASVDCWAIAKLCCQMILLPEDLPAPARSYVLGALGFCLGVLCFLCYKAGRAEWLVLSLTAGPVGLCWLASTWDVCGFAVRYFLMAHVCFLTGLAALIWRFVIRLERVIAAVGLLVIFIAADADFIVTMDLEHKPGPRGAAAFLAQNRAPEEPIIVSMPFFFFPLLHYSKERQNVFLYTDERAMPSYYGTAAMTREDLITAEGRDGLRSRRVWVVNMAGGMLGIQTVPVPARWKEDRRWVFADVFHQGEVILIAYDTTCK